MSQASAEQSGGAYRREDPIDASYRTVRNSAPSWGGVIGIWPRHHLVDGTETTQPEFSFWFSDVGFGVENYGTDPQIEIDNAPQDGASGNDRQLEKALKDSFPASDPVSVANGTVAGAPDPATGKPARPAGRTNSKPPVD